jgi:hypothetical protein
MDRFSLSDNVINSTVYYFNNETISFAYDVRRNLGRFLNYVINDNGKAVRPHEPQQINIG